jgi:outer membrane protein OmpA-like peptidoglycan-associated protein
LHNQSNLQVENCSSKLLPMSPDLSALVKSFITPDLISTASTFLGEDVPGISKAVDAAVPSLLSSIVARSSSDHASAFSLAKQAAGSGVFDDLAGLFSGNASLLNLGSGLVSGLLGNSTGVISSLISSYAGIKPSSATTLLNVVAPLALGTVGKHAVTNGLDAKGLSSFLISQKDSLNQAIPPGLNISGVIGVATEKPQAEYREQENAPGMPVWVLPLLLVVGGGLLIWYFLGGKKERDPEPVTTVAVQEAPPSKQMLKVELPDGTVMDAYKGGIEDQLVNFLKDPAAVAGKDVWFDFDNLNFATGTADITPESQAQINNIAAILKAFPKARIKIGGYTDKTGDESANLTLSKARAESVRSALGAAGVGAQITDAEGYGSQFARIPAEAPETSRAVDRRVSVSVREK